MARLKDITMPEGSPTWQDFVLNKAEEYGDKDAFVSLDSLYSTVECFVIELGLKYYHSLSQTHLEM